MNQHFYIVDVECGKLIIDSWLKI